MAAKPRSLKAGIFFWMLLVAALPLLFAATAMLGAQYRHEGEEARHETMTLAHQVRARFENILAGPQAVLAQNSAFLGLVRVDPGQLGMILDGAVGAADGFESMYMIDRNGRVIAAGVTRGTGMAGEMFKGIDLSAAPYFRAALKGKGPVWSDVRQSLFSGKNSVVVSIPVGETVLAGTLTIDHLDGQIKSLNLDPSLLVFLVDHHGTLLFHPDRKKVSQRVSYAAFAPVRAALSGREFAGEFIIDGEEFVGSATRVSGPGWAIVVARRLSDLHDYNRRVLLIFAVLFVLVMMVAFVVAMLVSSRIAGPVKKLAQGAEMVSRGSYDLEFPLQPYGELAALARAFRDMAAMVKGREGLLGDSYDRLNEQYVLQETLVDAVPLPLFFIDGEGLFIGCNLAFEKICGRGRDELAGLSPAALGGIGVPAFVTNLFAAKQRPGFDKIRDTLAVEARECKVIDNDGHTHIMLWQARAFAGINERYRGVVCVVVDISELRETEFHLRHAQKMEAIGTLAGGIAHDFNNVLNAILGYAELSLLEVEPGSPIAENLGHISAAGRRAADLVRQILTFSRRREGKPVPFLLGPVVKESVKLLSATVDPDIEIKCRVDPDCPAVVGDVSRGQQMVMNLCTNAIQAMREKGGILTIEMTREDNGASPRSHAQGWLRLRVADTGPGVPPSIRERIFEPYFSTKERGQGGTGLGLAMVHGIVEDFGGKIEVADNPGGGAAFTVWLPGCDTVGAVAGGEAVMPVMETFKGRVMLVDDEDMLRSFVGRALAMFGCEVDQFAEASGAMATFSKDPSRYDLVITDQVMPGMSGMELSRGVKALRPELPVVLFTGFSEKVSREEALAQGVNDYRIKPLTIADINEILKTFMAPKG